MRAGWGVLPLLWLQPGEKAGEDLALAKPVLDGAVRLRLEQGANTFHRMDRTS